MRNETRVKRLKVLEDMLKRHDELFPGTGFNMRSWCTSTPCDTAACALGSAAFYKPFIKLGLEIALDDGTLVPRFSKFFGYEAGQQFFGITEHEAGRMFDPDTYPPNNNWNPITTEQVARRVKLLIRKYEKQAA